MSLHASASYSPYQIRRDVTPSPRVETRQFPNASPYTLPVKPNADDMCILEYLSVSGSIGKWIPTSIEKENTSTGEVQIKALPDVWLTEEECKYKLRTRTWYPGENSESSEKYIKKNTYRILSKIPNEDPKNRGARRLSGADSKNAVITAGQQQMPGDLKGSVRIPPHAGPYPLPANSTADDSLLRSVKNVGPYSVPVKSSDDGMCILEYLSVHAGMGKWIPTGILSLNPTTGQVKVKAAPNEWLSEDECKNRLRTRTWHPGQNSEPGAQVIWKNQHGILSKIPNVDSRNKEAKCFADAYSNNEVPGGIQTSTTATPLTASEVTATDLTSFSDHMSTSFNFQTTQLAPFPKDTCGSPEGMTQAMSYIPPTPRGMQQGMRDSASSFVFGSVGPQISGSVSIPPEPAVPLKGIGVRVGLHIDQINFQYSDHSTRIYGGNGGEEKEPFALHAGEYLQQIQVIQKDSLDAVKFVTNQGRESLWYGHLSGGSGLHTLRADPGNQIYGVVRAGQGCHKILEVIQRPAPRFFSSIDGGEKFSCQTVDETRNTRNSSEELDSTEAAMKNLRAQRSAAVQAEDYQLAHLLKSQEQELQKKLEALQKEAATCIIEIPEEFMASYVSISTRPSEEPASSFQRAGQSAFTAQYAPPTAINTQISTFNDLHMLEGTAVHTALPTIIMELPRMQQNTVNTYMVDINTEIGDIIDEVAEAGHLATTKLVAMGTALLRDAHKDCEITFNPEAGIVIGRRHHTEIVKDDVLKFISADHFSVKSTGNGDGHYEFEVLGRNRVWLTNRGSEKVEAVPGKKLQICLGARICLETGSHWTLSWNFGNNSSDCEVCHFDQDLADLPKYSEKDIVDATNNFSQDRNLGRGAVAVVYRGELEGTSFAVKAVRDADQSDCFKREVKVLSQLQHQNVVKIFGWGMARHGQGYIVTELVSGGDLNMMLQKAKTAAAAEEIFLWKQRFEIAMDVAKGLSYIVNLKPKVFHRDIKPGNILLDAQGPAKLADFGIARQLEDVGQDHLHVKKVSRTPGYECPVYRVNGRVSEASEVYSFGVVMLELITNIAVSKRRGLQNLCEFPLMREIKPDAEGADDRVVSNKDESAQWPPSLVEYLAKLSLESVTAEPRERPTFNQILERFLQAIEGIIMSYLRRDGCRVAGTEGGQQSR